MQRKHDLTPDKVTAGKLAAMDDSGWSKVYTPWERLRWARLYWQSKSGGATTMVAAAESLGMNPDTYSAYERAPDSSKHTPLTDQRAIEFGKKFKVNWVWLLTGQETPFTRTAAQEKAVQLMSTADEAEQERIVDIVEAALRKRA